MKKILTILSIAFIGSTFAQKGSWYIGGSVGMNSSKTTFTPNGGTKTETGKDFSWVAAPEFGTFLADTWQLGLALGVSGQSMKGNDTISSMTISPTLYARKFFKITDNFSLFAGLYGNFTTGNETRTVNAIDVKSTVSGFGARLGVGIAYAFSDRFTAVGQYGLVGFSSSTSKDNNSNVMHTSGFDFGVNTVGSSILHEGNNSGSVFNIGLYYTLFK